MRISFTGDVDSTEVNLSTVSLKWKDTTTGQTTATGAANAVTIVDENGKPVSKGKYALVTFAYLPNFEYTFTCQKVSGSAVVTIGSYKVVSIELNDQEAEVGVKYPVQYKLIAENDVDVTKYAGNAAATISFTQGNGLVDSSTNASNPWVWFDEAYKYTDVTIKHADLGKDDPGKTARITSKMPTATEATPKFADSLLKWYLPNVTGNASGEWKRNTNSDAFQVVFWAQKNTRDYDEFDSAVIFNSAVAKSSNDNVAEVKSITSYAGGKYFILSVKPGATVGEATITISTTETKGSYENLPGSYTFKVRTGDKVEQFTKVDYPTSAGQINNSTFYANQTATFTPQNSLNENVDTTAVIESVEFIPADSGVIKSTLSDVTTGIVSGWTGMLSGGQYESAFPLKNVATAAQKEKGGFWFRLDRGADLSYTLKYSAFNAARGTYTFTIIFKGDSKSEGVTRTAKYSVRVTDILSTVYGKSYATDGSIDLNSSVEYDTDGVTVLYKGTQSDGKVVSTGTAISGNYLNRSKLNAEFKTAGVDELKLSDAGNVVESSKLSLDLYIQGQGFAHVGRTSSATALLGYDATNANELLSVLDNKKAMDVDNGWQNIRAYVTGISATTTRFYSRYYPNVANAVAPTLYLGQIQRTFADQVNVGLPYVTAWNGDVPRLQVGSQISLKNIEGQEVVFYGANSIKNTVAESGTYKIYWTKTGKQITSSNQASELLGEKTFAVSYSLTMPKVHYFLSTDDDVYALSDVDMVRAEADASVENGTYQKYNSTAIVNDPLQNTIKANAGLFGLNRDSREVGDKIYSVVIRDYRGVGENEVGPGGDNWTYYGGAATAAYANWYTPNAGDTPIFFVLEQTNTITK